MIWFLEVYHFIKGETMKAVINLAQTFVKENTSVYDIGCSTGTLLSQCEKIFNKKSNKYCGIDSSPFMLKKPKEKLKKKENIFFLFNQNIEKELLIKKRKYSIYELYPSIRSPTQERYF